MNLVINGQHYTFIPLKAFRAEYSLPESFNVALFEPKDYSGLGKIDQAGSALNIVRDAVLAALPRRINSTEWLDLLDTITAVFDQKLREINPRIGLRDPEIGFAVSGFADVCQSMAFALIRARASHTGMPTFKEVYNTWLNSSTRISQSIHRYTYQDETWMIRLVTHAYGRAGMIVETSQEVLYVYDSTLSCPAEGFMVSLLRDVANTMVEITQ